MSNPEKNQNFTKKSGPKNFSIKEYSRAKKPLYTNNFKEYLRARIL